MISTYILVQTVNNVNNSPLLMPELKVLFETISNKRKISNCWMNIPNFDGKFGNY